MSRRSHSQTALDSPATASDSGQQGHVPGHPRHPKHPPRHPRHPPRYRHPCPRTPTQRRGPRQPPPRRRRTHSAPTASWAGIPQRSRPSRNSPGCAAGPPPHSRAPFWFGVSGFEFRFSVSESRVECSGSRFLWFVFGVSGLGCRAKPLVPLHAGELLAVVPFQAA